MSDNPNWLRDVLDRREEQRKRVTAVTEDWTREHLIQAMLGWMDMDQVDKMLKLWEGDR